MCVILVILCMLAIFQKMFLAGTIFACLFGILFFSVLVFTTFTSMLNAISGHSVYHSVMLC